MYAVHVDSPIGTGHAQSMFDSPVAWVAGANADGNRNDGNQFMIIDVGSDLLISGIKTQPRAAPYDYQFVTKFELQYWKDGQSSSDAVSVGDISDSDGYATWYFTEYFATSADVFNMDSVEGRYFKIIAREHSGYTAMRAALIGCP